MWTLANSPRVPEKIRQRFQTWGLAKDEFTDNDNWPHQLYVREARRMVSAYVMTENDCKSRRTAEDSVGLAAYGMDSHHTQRYVDATGHARNEGDVEVGVPCPYPISYRSIVPKSGQCSNLLVPICVSATHIAYGSIRMEPVFMILGQSAGTAAVAAVEEDTDVQKVEYARLRQRLLDDRQILVWTGPRGRLSVPIDPKQLPGIVIDDSDADLTGEWIVSTASASFVGTGYRHDGNADKQGKQARFQARLPRAGRYEVRFAYTPNSNRAADVPVTVRAADGDQTVHVDEQKAPPMDGAFISLGIFPFDADKPAAVVVSCVEAGAARTPRRWTRGYVVIDAVQFLEK